MTIGKRVTQSDIARRVGVSVQTVSKVLNNRLDGGIPILEETRQRILSVAQELGYQPDARARSLRSGRAGTIGVLIPDGTNPQFWALVRGAEALASEQGYDTAVCISGRELERERRALQSLAQRRMDGLILLLHYPERLADELDELNLQDAPLVTLNWVTPRKDVVVQRYDEGAAEMMDHLLRLGHRRIGFIHGVARPTLGRDRLLVYRQALVAAGIAADERLIVACESTLEGALQASLSLLDQQPRPTAILAVNDWAALGALQAAAQRGLRVPQDISIAGFGDIDISAYLVPPLTTVRADFEEVGKRAAALLLQRLEEPQLPPQRVDVRSHLVVRQSTGPCTAPGDEIRKVG